MSVSESNSTPLTLVVFGKCGVGKSSTLNALFQLNFQTDDVIPCTGEPNIELVTLNIYGSDDLIIRVVDLPGIGESLQADSKYFQWYQKWIVAADHILWITQANTRAYRRDQLFLLGLKELIHPKVIFTIGINQVDKLGVDEGKATFDIANCTPSTEQLVILEQKVDDIFMVFKEVLSDKVAFVKTDIISYSAKYRWGLDNLAKRIALRVSDIC